MKRVRTALIGVLVTTLAAAGVVTVPMAASAAATSTISGKITGPAGVTLSPDDINVTACTYISSQLDCSVADTTVSAGGTYSLAVPAGKYTVFAEYTGQENARDEYFPNAQYGAKATYFAVKAGATASGKNLALDAGGIVTGTVAYNGNPVEGLRVSTHPIDPAGAEPQPFEFSETGSALTSDSGNYRIAGIWPGKYGVRANDFALNGFTTLAGEWFGNTPLARDATQLAITSTSDLDASFELEVGGSISGTVRSVLNTPLANVNVRAWRYTDPDNSRVATLASDDAVTHSNGEFTISGLVPGEYTLEYVTGDHDGLIDGFYGTAGATIKTAGRLTVNGDVNTTEGVVSIGGSYVGRVLDPEGQPFEGVTVSTNNSSATDVAPVVTDVNGEFTIRGFPRSTKGYVLTFSFNGFGTTTLSAARPTFNGSPWQLNDVYLAGASSIRGTVVNAAGAAVKNARIGVYTVNLTGRAVYVSSTTTNSKGAYVVPALADGGYYLSVSAKGYPVQYAGGTTDISLVDPTWVYPNQAVTKNIRLYSGGTISGIVKNAKGKPVKGAWVGWSRVALDGEPDVDGSSVVTNAKGAYVIGGINPGSYELDYNVGATGANVALGTVSTSVFVGDKGSATKTVSLGALTKVTGVVTKTGGTALAGVDVAAFVEGSAKSVTATTTSTGAYTLYLAPNTYAVSYTDPQRRGAAVTTSEVAVTSSALPALNAELPVRTGSVTTTLTGVFDAGLYGTVWLYNAGTERWVSYESNGPLQSVFPIANLTDGQYQLEIQAYDSDAGFAAGVNTLIEFTVTNGEAVTLAPIALVKEFADNRQNPTLAGTIPQISGSAQVGEQLTAQTGLWVIGNISQYTGDYKVQWLRGNKPIPGATNRTYTVTPGDTGANIRVRVIPIRYSFPNDVQTITGLYALAEVSPPTGQVPLLPGGSWSTVPSVSGAARVGQPLTVNPGVSALSGSTFGYSWVRTTGAGTVIVSRAASYKPVAADLAATLSVRVQLSKPGYSGSTFEVQVGTVSPAAALKRIKAGKVTIVGSNYSVTPGTWSPTGATFSYEWRAWHTDGDYTVGSTASSWNDVDAESLTRHKTVVITASKAGYTSTRVELQVQNATTGLQWSNPPVVAGTNQVGRVLSVDLSGATVVPTQTALSYQWSVKGKAVKGATQATFTPTVANSAVAVIVAAKRVGYAPAVTAPISAGTTTASSGPLTGSVSIAGLGGAEGQHPLVGRTLGVTTSTISPTATTLSYQWVRYSEGVASVISKATKRAYTVTAADTGKQLAVRVTAKKAGYSTTTFESSASDDVTLVAPILLSPPRLPVTTVVGTRVTATTGTWDVSGLTFSYAWFINNREIKGATGSSYTPLAQDEGEELWFTVVASKAGLPASNPAGASSTVTVQRGAAPLASKAPSITVAGKAVTTVARGKTLTATPGTWSATGVALTYAWQYSTDNGVSWNGLWSEDASSNSLTITADELVAGTRIRVVVYSSKAGYTGGFVNSKAVLVK